MTYVDPTKKYQKRFKDHVPTRLANGWWKFAKPGTSIDMLCFHFFGGYMMVVGDLGDAVYHWNQQATPEWVAGCNLDYFLGKCQASETGRDFKKWDIQDCLDDLEKWAIQDFNKEDKPRPDLSDARFAIEDGEIAWQAYLYDHGYETFGDEFYEFAPKFGVRPHIRGVLHLAALKVMVGKMGRL
jgi:hypothetical protein